MNWKLFMLKSHTFFSSFFALQACYPKCGHQRRNLATIPIRPSSAITRVAYDGRLGAKCRIRCTMSHRWLLQPLHASGLGASRPVSCLAPFPCLCRCGSDWCVSCFVISLRLVGVVCTAGRRRLSSFHWSCDSDRFRCRTLLPPVRMP